MNNPLRHYKITVTGKVQGVYYRKSCLNQAIALGIRGNVKNLANGDVYIEAEGYLKELNAFLKWCEIGPSGAHVDELSFSEDKPQYYHEFAIRYA